jgi:hypothetical protein
MVDLGRTVLAGLAVYLVGRTVDVPSGVAVQVLRMYLVGYYRKQSSRQAQRELFDAERASLTSAQRPGINRSA